MDKTDRKSIQFNTLRLQAEALFEQNPEALTQMPPDHIQKLVNELEVRHIELELQNEELRRTQNELEESRNKYFDLFDLAPVGYFTFDKNGLIVEANLTGAVFLGIERCYLIKRYFRDFIAPEFQETFYNHRKQVFESGVRQACELKLAKKDGPPLYTRLDSIALQNSTEGQFRTAITDITRRKRMEEEKAKLEAQIRQAQKMEMVGTLAGGIAHDMNNLLQPIIMNTELLLMDDWKEKPPYEMLVEIETASYKASELISQLLTFSRKMDSEFSTVDLNQEIKNVKRLLSRTIPKMIAIKLQLADDLKNIKADSNQVEQVLINLAVNARDAMPDGGKLTVITENITLDKQSCKDLVGIEAGDYVLLTFSDTGCGMDAETREHIFEPFYSTKEPDKGTGLGLSTVYGIVISHYGHIGCTSNPGQGTAFHIYWPATEKTLKPGKILEELPCGGTETILVVDDEESILDACEQILTNFGYRVVLASDCEKAIELYKRENIDMVFMDLILPGMGGKQGLKSLLQINKQAKVIITSGFFPEGAPQKIIEAGAKGFIKKPYSSKQLLRVVREVLDDKSL